MGMRGYKVYRHMGRYYVYYNCADSYPEGLGLEILNEIPRNVSKEEFEEWVRKTREYVYSQRDSQELNNPDDSTSRVSDNQPKNDIYIEWIYEIDLDNFIFHVDSQPLFRLDNMPPDDIFIDSISYDHFGHRALYENTPTQFRYNWRAPPPSPLPESLDAYNHYNNRSSTSSVHDLLNIPVVLSSIDRVRTALVELLITRCMVESFVGHDVRVLENVPDRNHIPQSMLQLALSFVDFAVGSPIHTLPFIRHITRHNIDDFVWIRRDACLRITTHLDDEDNLKASVGDLVHHINTTLDKAGTIYGIACSIFHCAIVRVDKDEQGTSFAHTSALQFLPSFYARTMFTPGLEALSRLGCQANGVEFLNAIPGAKELRCFKHKELLANSSVASKVPVEVWTRIGGFITTLGGLVTLASISTRAMSAAADLTRFPLVKNFRLVEVIASGPVEPIPETTESTDPEAIWDYAYHFGWAKFRAVRGGRDINVKLCLHGHRDNISFEAQTCVYGMYSKLYVSELDDDEASS